MKTKNQKPWLDQRGRSLTIEQLKEISKSWTEKTWSKYLDSLDGSVEGLQLGSSRKLKIKSEYLVKSIFDEYAQVNEPVAIQNKIQAMLSILTERQRKVIELTFFDGLSFEEAAAEMSLSKAVVYRHQLSALKKLRSANLVTGHDLTDMRAKENFKPEPPVGISLEIYEVYLEDMNR